MYQLDSGRRGTRRHDCRNIHLGPVEVIAAIGTSQYIIECPTNNGIASRADLCKRCKAATDVVAAGIKGEYLQQEYIIEVVTVPVHGIYRRVNRITRIRCNVLERTCIRLKAFVRQQVRTRGSVSLFEVDVIEIQRAEYKWRLGTRNR